MEKVNPMLEIEDEIDLHRKGWVIQKIGWAIILLTVIAASAGLFGTGILSNKHITGKEGTVRFERFVRFESPTELTIEGRSNGENIEVVFPSSYFLGMELDKIQPAPTMQRIESGSIVYRFSTRENALIKFYLIPETIGNLSTHLMINDETYFIHHFIYP
jgi:hypothetical protein